MEKNQSAKMRTYFDLIEAVGDNGVYQRNLFYLFLLSWTMVGMIAFNTSYMFLRRNFKCQEFGLQPNTCQSYICQQKGFDESTLYNMQVYSLAQEFGPFYCEKSHFLFKFRMSPHIGFILSFLFYGFFDKNGRKRSLTYSSLLQFFGLLILALSVNIWMASFGIILASIGAVIYTRTSMIILLEIVQNTQRQKYSVGLEAGIAAAALFVGFTFWLVPHWRKVIIIFYLIPSIIQCWVSYAYFRQTPLFLIKDKENAVKILNQIGVLNKGQKNIIKIQDIENVINYECQTKQCDVVSLGITHLFSFRSLRRITIGLCILYLCKRCITYGPLILIDSLGIGVFMNQMVMGLSQLIAIPLAYLKIEVLSRRKTGFYCFSAAFLFFLFIAVFPRNQSCKYCAENIFSLALLFLLRIITTFYYPIMNIFTAELYPLKIRGLGFGIVGCVGQLGGIFSQVFLLELQNGIINPVFVILLATAGAIFAVFLLPETLGKPLKTEIEQTIQINKMIKLEGQLQPQLQLNDPESQKQFAKA